MEPQELVRRMETLLREKSWYSVFQLALQHREVIPFIRGYHTSVWEVAVFVYVFPALVSDVWNEDSFLRLMTGHRNSLDWGETYQELLSIVDIRKDDFILSSDGGVIYSSGVCYMPGGLHFHPYGNLLTWMSKEVDEFFTGTDTPGRKSLARWAYLAECKWYAWLTARD